MLLAEKILHPCGVQPSEDRRSGKVSTERSCAREQIQNAVRAGVHAELNRGSLSRGRGAKDESRDVSADGFARRADSRRILQARVTASRRSRRLSRGESAATKGQHGVRKVAGNGQVA